MIEKYLEELFEKYYRNSESFQNLGKKFEENDNLWYNLVVMNLA
jgi:hypothetical protein